MNHFNTSQMVLPLSSVPVFSFDNFTLGLDNRIAFQTLLQFTTADCNSECLVIVGKSGSGKTHLLKAAIEKKSIYSACLYLHVEEIRSLLSGSSDVNHCLQLLSHYQHINFLALDGLELLENNESAQEFVLYFFNFLKANHGKILVASKFDPGHIPGLRVELKSRLLWGSVVSMGVMNDSELGLVMKKIGFDRGLDLSEDLVNFLVTRLPRSPHDYVQAIDQLDQYGMKLSRNISIPLAKDVLQL
ncbi:MAG: ATP-binding protein [Magnetococcales bacterium]|nr:ATP-binding protein [Magnetococcales bacterium]MBF0419655.1 ATP-binding protein [Magnetococcales bacterium]